MTLIAGTRLGPYLVETPLGVGGMGEVYRARDTKLGRDVALKVISATFAGDADRITRFEREAKVLAALNHPNIAALYGMEVENDRHFLIMELVEGETLAERLARGALPIEQALSIGLQMAEALEAAHEQGVVHRDLKPANVKITPDEKVKVLDFGLAKLAAPESVRGQSAATPALTNSPTLSVMATAAGMVMGTAAYMSPEQAWDGAEGALRRVAVAGGPAVRVCAASNPFGLSWDGDWIVFGQPRAIVRVASTGGEPETSSPLRRTNRSTGLNCWMAAAPCCSAPPLTPPTIDGTTEKSWCSRSTAGRGARWCVAAAARATWPQDTWSTPWDRR